MAVHTTARSIHSEQRHTHPRRVHANRLAEDVSRAHRVHHGGRTGHRSEGLAPHVRNRIGALIAIAGLVLALVSLYLPWLAGSTRDYTALQLTEVVDVTGIAPVLFFGLVVTTLLVVTSAMTRLGIFAILATASAALVLAAHVVLMVILGVSAGRADPWLAGVPSDSALTYGPFVAALALTLTVVGSARAIGSAQHGMPDRWQNVEDRDWHAGHPETHWSA